MKNWCNSSLTLLESHAMNVMILNCIRSTRKRLRKGQKFQSKDFETLTSVIEEHLRDHPKISYATVCQLLAESFLGAGQVKNKDLEYRGRSSKQISVMHWSLGNWCRKKFGNCPVPTQLERFYQQIDCEKDEHGNEIKDWKYNNYFIQVMRNVGTHILMNCEASSVYPHRHLLEGGDWKVCFNDWTDNEYAGRH